MSAMSEAQARTTEPIPICPKCGEPLEYEWPAGVAKAWNLYGDRKRLPCVCKCERERIEQEEKEFNHRHAVEELRRRSGLAGKYLDARFPAKDAKDFDPTYLAAARRLRKYAANSQIILSGGWGFYLWGNPGTGKTYLAAATANALMEQEREVVFTTFAQICQEIRATYDAGNRETERYVLARYRDAQFLFVDDIGTETMAKNGGDNFSQDRLFQLIDWRATRQMPTAFTSNHRPDGLIDRQIQPKTIDRIIAMTAGGGMEVRGKSLRKAILAKTPF